MYPILINWGPIVLPTWHVCFVIAAIVSHRVLLWLAEKTGSSISIRTLNVMFVIAYVCGYFGSRAANILVDNEPFSGILGFFNLLFAMGGMLFYGGFIFGGLATAAFLLATRTDWRKCLDLAIPPSFLGLAIGRVGCFLNGDDFGLPVPMASGSTAPWWSITLPNLEDGIPRYPVQLMEAFVAGLLFVALILCLLRWRQRPGLIGALGLVGYGFSRYILEEFRGDPRGWIFDPSLSTSQAISLGVIAAFALLAAAITLNSHQANSSSRSPSST